MQNLQKNNNLFSGTVPFFFFFFFLFFKQQTDNTLKNKIKNKKEGEERKTMIGLGMKIDLLSFCLGANASTKLTSM